MHWWWVFVHNFGWFIWCMCSAWVHDNHNWILWRRCELFKVSLKICTVWIVTLATPIPFTWHVSLRVNKLAWYTLIFTRSRLEIRKLYGGDEILRNILFYTAGTHIQKVKKKIEKIRATLSVKYRHLRFVNSANLTISSIPKFLLYVETLISTLYMCCLNFIYGSLNLSNIFNKLSNM